jgi:hypothetical protein
LDGFINTTPPTPLDRTTPNAELHEPEYTAGHTRSAARSRNGHDRTHRASRSAGVTGVDVEVVPAVDGALVVALVVADVVADDADGVVTTTTVELDVDTEPAYGADVHAAISPHIASDVRTGAFIRKLGSRGASERHPRASGQSPWCA